MKKILFVTDRNVLTTSGELRLIKNRAEALFQEHRIITDFIIFAKKSRIDHQNETIKAGGSQSIYEIAFSKPAVTLKSFTAVRKIIKKRLETHEYRTVVLSGPFMILYAKAIEKEFRIPVIADIHGAFEDMVELSRTSSFSRGLMFRICYALEKGFIKRNSKYISGFFAVTDALKEYLIRTFNTDDSVNFFIIPCATNNTLSSVSEYLEDRKKYRERYHIDDDEIVFIYSGGVSPWQCVDKTIELYRSIDDHTERKTRMLAFSHRKEDLMKLIGDDPRINTDSYPPDELLHVLHAGDYAFLLREDNITNNVAFPNKYLEYVQSGMKIITSPYVKEIAKQVSENNLGYIYDFKEDTASLVDYIEKSKLNSYRAEDIDKVLTENSFSKTTQDFCKWFFSEDT